MKIIVVYVIAPARADAKLGKYLGVAVSALQ
jgi:hypothetical protein